MKTAASVPDDVAGGADAVAGEGADPVTAALDSLADEPGVGLPGAPARRLIDSAAWEW